MLEKVCPTNIHVRFHALMSTIEGFRIKRKFEFRRDVFKPLSSSTYFFGEKIECVAKVLKVSLL